MGRPGFSFFLQRALKVMGVGVVLAVVAFVVLTSDTLQRFLNTFSFFNTFSRVDYQAEASLVVLPNTVFKERWKQLQTLTPLTLSGELPAFKLGGVEQPHRYLASAMKRVAIQKKVYQRYHQWAKAEHQTVFPASAFQVWFVPKENEYALDIRVKGPEAQATQKLTALEANAALGYYDEFLSPLPLGQRKRLEAHRQRLVDRLLPLQEREASEQAKVDQLLASPPDRFDAPSLQQELLQLGQAEATYRGLHSIQQTLLKQLDLQSVEAARLSSLFTDDPVMERLRQQYRKKLESIAAEPAVTNDAFGVKEEWATQTIQHLVPNGSYQLGDSTTVSPLLNTLPLVQAETRHQLFLHLIAPAEVPLVQTLLATSFKASDAKRQLAQLRARLPKTVRAYKASHSSPGISEKTSEPASESEALPPETEQLLLATELADLEQQLNLFHTLSTQFPKPGRVQKAVNLIEATSWSDRMGQWLLSVGMAVGVGLLVCFSLFLFLAQERSQEKAFADLFTDVPDETAYDETCNEACHDDFDQGFPADLPSDDSSAEIRLARQSKDEVKKQKSGQKHDMPSREPAPSGATLNSVYAQSTKLPVQPTSPGVGFPQICSEAMAQFARFPGSLKQPGDKIPVLAQRMLLERFQQLQITNERRFGILGEPALAGLIAAAYLSQGQRVCLLDFQVDQPLLHTLAEDDNTWGVIDLLMRPLESSQLRAQTDPLLVIPTGKTYQNSQAFSEFRTLPLLLQKLDARFDRVIAVLPKNWERRELFSVLLGLSGDSVPDRTRPASTVLYRTAVSACV